MSFPHITLTDGERIDSIEVTMTCGRFAAINHIPDDWSAEVISPVSEVTTFKASTGHGSTALWHSADLDGLITIIESPDDCFDISAKIEISAMEKDRTVSLSRRELILKP